MGVRALRDDPRQSLAVHAARFDQNRTGLDRDIRIATAALSKSIVFAGGSRGRNDKSRHEYRKMTPHRASPSPMTGEV
jgi:hypothetical protein